MKLHKHLLLSSPRQQRLFKLVQRGYRVHLQVVQLSDQLHLIEGMLKAEALDRPLEHLALVDSDADTVEWIASGPGCQCHIIFPKPTLQTSFVPSPSDWRAILQLCDLRISHLFNTSVMVHIADPVAFRQKVKELFNPLDGARLIQLCSFTPEPRFVWDESPPVSQPRPTEKSTDERTQS